jgi:hypothetical protein
MTDENSHQNRTRVKGHQDKDEAFEQLTIPEKLNAFADHLATYALDLGTITKAEPDQGRTRPTVLSARIWSISPGGLGHFSETIFTA